MQNKLFLKILHALIFSIYYQISKVANFTLHDLDPIVNNWPWWHCRTHPWPWSTYRDPHTQTTRSWSDWAQSPGCWCTCPGSFSSLALGYCPCRTPSVNPRTWCLPASGNHNSCTKIEQEQVTKDILQKANKGKNFSVSTSKYIKSISLIKKFE